MTDKPEDGALDLGELIDALRPHLPGLVQTIAVAGSATTDKDGKVTPGDIRAASIGLELVSKYLAGRGSDRASRILREIKAINDGQSAVDSPAKGQAQPDDSDSS